MLDNIHFYEWVLVTWDNVNNPITRTATTAGVSATKTYYFGASRVAVRENGVLSYLHSDQLSSVSASTDANGKVVGRQLFEPFGAVRAEFGEVDGTWGWATHRKSENTGLTFMRARWYAPGVGRFIQPDSVVPGPSEPQAFNRYSYGSNTPMKYNDPTGHWVDRPGEQREPIPDSGRHMQTGKAGIIDREHATSSVRTASYILNQVNNLVEHGGTFPLKGNLTGSSLLLDLTYRVAPGTTKSQADGIALAIYQDYQLRFEQAQGDHGIAWSQFSFEDLPSDLVAFSMAKTGYNLGTTLQDLGGYKGTESGGFLGDMYRDFVNPMNREFRPIHTDGPDQGKNYDWPDRFPRELDVQPVMTGWSVVSQSTPRSKLKDLLPFPLESNT